LDEASLASVGFDADSKVSRLKGSAFAKSGLRWIHMASLVETICESCFSECELLASVAHDPDLKLCPTFSALLIGLLLIYRRCSCA
jgi:hypothetical protein